MDDKRKIAIVGISNVGKSTLFNKLCQRHLSLSFDQDDTTVDYISYTIDNQILVDTCGIKNLKSFEDISGQFILNSDIILYVFDGRQKPLSVDIEICKFLKKNNKTIWLIGNKTENHHIELNDTKTIVSDKVFWVSSEHNIGIEEIAIQLELKYTTDNNTKLPLIGIIGRANSGKSTLMNALLGYDRVKIEDKIGTTRDNVIVTADTVYHRFNFMDTAGYRTDNCALEYITKKRRDNSFKYVDGFILVLDGQLGLTKLDKQILDEAMEYGQFFIICINKSDSLSDDPSVDFKYFNIPEWFPMIKISAKNNKLGKLKEIIDFCYIKTKEKLTTNKITNLIQENEGKIRDTNNKVLRIKYAFQKSINPFIISYFAHHDISKNSKTFLSRLIAKNFDLKGVNLKFERLQRLDRHNVV
jgi:GTP-binding protein